MTNIVNLSSKRVLRLSPSGRNEEAPLGLNSTRSVSYHYFGWAFPSSAKSRIDDYRQNWVQNAFFDFPHRGETKKHRWNRNPRSRFHTTILGGLFQAAQKAEWTNIVKLSSKRVFRLSPSGRNEKTPLGSNCTRSVSYHYFGWAFPSSAESRIDDYRQIEFKTRFSTFPIGAKRKNTVGIKLHEVGFIPPFWVGFSKQRKKPNWRISSNSVQNAFFDFPHRGETKKHRWDRIARGRFHTTILDGLFQAAQKAGLTKVAQMHSKRVFSTFPIGAKRKNTLWIEFHEVGFIPPFWVGFSKQRKKPGWRKSPKCVQSAFFRLSPSGRNVKTPFRSNSTRSVSYHHFGWAFPSSAKSRVDEGHPNAFKTRFFDFPHRCETKKHPWDRIPRGRFHTFILDGLFQAAQKAGLTKVTQMRSKRVFSTFPIDAKRKNTLGIEFHEVGFIRSFWMGFSKQRKKPGWRRSPKCVQNAFFRLSPSMRNEKTPLGSNSTRSVSYVHFGWAFPSSAKSRVDEGRPNAFKTRFFDFPHRGETKKHPLDRIPRGRFHTTILGGLFQAAQKAGLTKVAQMRSKRVFSTFPIDAKRKNTLGIEFDEVGFIRSFWMGFSKERKKPGWQRSPKCVQNAFFRLSPSMRNEKTPLGSNSTRSVSYVHFGWAFPSSAKSRVDEGRPNAFKTRFFDFPHRCETKKHPLDRIRRGRLHITILGGLFQAAKKAGLTKVAQKRSKRVFSTFPIDAKRKNTLGIEFHEVSFIRLFWKGFSKQRKKPGWRRSPKCVHTFFRFWKGKNTLWARFHTRVGFSKRKKPGWRRSPKCVQNAFFRLSLSMRNEKTPLGSNSTRSVSYVHFGWAFPRSAKSRVDKGRPNAFKTRFFDFPHRCETKKHPWDRIPRGQFHTFILDGLFQAAQKAGLTKVAQMRSKRVFSTFPIDAKRKNTLGIEFHEVSFIRSFWMGFSKQRKKPGWRRSPKCVQNAFFRLSPSGRNEKTPFGSNSTRSVSYHHFGWAFPSSAKSRVDEGRPNAFKTRFFDFPHRCETKKHPWDRIPRGRFHTFILDGLFQAAQKAGLTKVTQMRSKRVFSTFPIDAKRKNTLGIEFHEVSFIRSFWMGFSKQRKKPGWRRSPKCVQNAFFRLSPSMRNEKTPLGSNSTRSVSYVHFGWAFPSSAKSRVDEGRPNAFKTRFFDFPYRCETKKHPLDRIPRGRFHTFILDGLFQAAQKAGLTKVAQMRSKRVFSTFPIGAKRKNTLWIEFHEVGFIPPFWVGFSKQRKKPGWRRSPKCVQNAFFRLSPSMRNEKTPLGSNSTRSVSYVHFGWAFPSSAKSRVDEGRPNAFKTRFFDFPIRCETKKHPWDRIPRGRFHTFILDGLFQAAQKAGLTKVTQMRSKRVFSTFPIDAKRKNTLGIEFHEVGFIRSFWMGFSKERKKPGWRRSPKCVQNAFFRLSPSMRNEKTPLGSNSTRSVSYVHFGWAFPSSAKSRVDEGRPNAFKTRFFDFPHRGETKKHPLDRIPRGRFHTTILGGLFQAAQKAGLTKVAQMRSKRVFSTFPIDAKRKNTLGIEFHEVGFIRSFWMGFSKQRKKPGWRKSPKCVQSAFFRLSLSMRNEKTPLGSNSTRSVSYVHFGWAFPSSAKSRVDEGRPNAFKTRFFDFPHQCETKKHPWDRIPRGRFHTFILDGLFQAAQKAGLTKVTQMRSKRVFSTFPIDAKRKNTLGIEFHEVGFIRSFWMGFSKERKKPGWRRSPKCVQNAFFRLSLSMRNEKTPLGSNSTRSVSYVHFGWAFPSSAKSRVDEGRPNAFKTRFFDFPHRGETKKHPLDRIPRGRFHTTILGGLFQAAQKAGLTKVAQMRSKRVFSTFPINAKRKNTLGIEFHEVGFIRSFWMGFSKQRKKPGWRRSPKCVQNAFFRLSLSMRNEKTPLGSNSTRSVSYVHFGWAFPSSAKSRVDEGRPNAFKTRFFDFPHRCETKKHPWDRIPRGQFHTFILDGLFQAAQKAGLTKVAQMRSKRVFSTFPIDAKRKNTLGIEFHEVGFIRSFWMGFSKQRKKPGWRRSPKCVQNAFFRLSLSMRNEKTPLGSNSTRSVSYVHFGWAFPSSAKSRVDEGRPNAFKTRFFDFPHRCETKKHPWDRIPRGRFHTFILDGLFQAAQKAGLTKVAQMRSKRVFSTFPIDAKRKNTLGIEFHEVSFIRSFWMGFSKQRKKPGWRRSPKCVQNAFFRLSPSMRNEKTPLGSNSTRSVSYVHFGWAFPSSAKSRVDEGRPNAFKTRFFDFPHRCETKKHPWDRIPRGRFHTFILDGLFQAAQKAGLTKVAQMRSKRVFSTFPIDAKRKNTLGIEFHEVGFIRSFWMGFSKQRKKPGWRRSPKCVQNAFFRLSPSMRNEKTPLGSNSTRSVSYVHFGWAFPSSAKSRVDEGRPNAFKTRFFENAFFRLSPSMRNEKTPLGSNSTRSVSYVHFGWAFPSSAKSRVDEGRPNAFKTRFFDFPHRGETKKHPLDRIPRGRFHTTILGGLFQAAQKAGLTKVAQMRSKRVFSTFPIDAKRKNTLGIEFHEVGFIRSFWMGFSKERKKPGWRRSPKCVQNAFFRLSPSMRNEKTPLGSNSTRSVSYVHFGWAFPSSAKSRVDEGRPNAFKTRFFDFPHRGETKKHPWDRIPRGRFHTTILGGLFQAAQKAGLTKVAQMRSKRVFSTFPIDAKRKNTLGIEFHEVGFIRSFWMGFSKERKKPGWRRSPKCVQNAFFRLSPSMRNEKTPLGSNSTRSVSYVHFGWAFPSSAKSRVDEGRPNAFKTRFFDFPHRGETKKHPWDRIPRGRFHTTILDGLFQAAQKAGLTKVAQMRSKRVFSTFPIDAKRKNTLGIEFHEVGFIRSFWMGFSKQRKKPGWRRSPKCVQNAFFRLSPSMQNEKTPLGSNSTRSVSSVHFGWAFPSSAKSRVDEGRPNAFKTRFFDFPHRGETKKHPLDRIPRGRFHTTILGGLFQAAQKAGLTKVAQMRSKRVFSTFPIDAKRKNTLGIEFHEVGFIRSFWMGFSKERKKPGWRRSPKCVQNAFFRLSPSMRNEKTPLGSNSTRSVSYVHFGWAFPRSAKSRVDEGRPNAFKTRFFDFPHRCETKKHPWDRIPRGRFHTFILDGLFQGAQKAGLTKVAQMRSKRVFSTFPIDAKRKNTLGIEFHEVGFIRSFWMGFSKERKKPGWRRSPKCVQNAFFRLSPSMRNEKTPLGSNSTRSVSYVHFGWAFPSSAKSRVDEGRPNAFKTRFFDFPHRGETKKHPWDRIPRGRFHTTILGGLFQAAQKAGLTKVAQMRSKRVFSTFPIDAKRKNTLGIEFHEVGFIRSFWMGFSKERKKPGWRRSPKCVQNAFFRLSPSMQNEKTPLGSNSTRSVSYVHFGWAFPSSAKSRVDEGRPNAFKTRFFDFPHRAKRKNTLGIEFHEVGFIPPFWMGFSKQRKKPGWRRSPKCVQNAFFRLSPSMRNEKTPLGSGFSKQRKKPGWRRSPKCVQNAFFRLSPSMRNEKTPLGSNSTRSVSYVHFGWAFPRSAKSRVDEGRPNAFKTRFFDFPHRCETKKHPWDQIPRGRFHTFILDGLFQGAQKAGLTKVAQMRSKRVFSTFPIDAKRKNTLGIEFHEVGFIRSFWMGFSKQRKKPGWRRSPKCVQNAFFRLSPSMRNEKTPLGSNSTRSVSYVHFGWAFPSSAKSRVDEGRPNAFKTRFFDFPHRGETKKHPWDRIPRGRFHTTILGGLFQAAQKAGLTKVAQMRSKRVFSTFPIDAKRKNTLGIKFHEVGFIRSFWMGFSKQRKKPGWRRSPKCVQNAFFRLSPSMRNEKTPLGSNSTRSVSYVHFGWAFPRSAKSRVDEGRPNAFKTRFFDFPHRCETKKHPWDRIPRGRFHTFILDGLFQAAQKAGLTKVAQMRSKRVFSTFPIDAKRKNTLGIEFHEVGFIRSFWMGFSKQRKKPGWRRSPKCVQNAFFDFPHRCETKKHPWDQIPRGRFHTFILDGLFQAAQKAGLTKVAQMRSKRVFSTFPIDAKRKNPIGIEFHEVGFIRFHTFILDGLFQGAQKAGLTKVAQMRLKRVFSTFSIDAKRKKKPLGSNSTRSVSYVHFGWAFPSNEKSRVDEGRLIAFKTPCFAFPHRGEANKHPRDQIPPGRFHTTILGGLFQVVQKAGLTKVVQLRSKRLVWTFPIRAKRINTLGIKFHQVGFIPPFWVGFSK